jgi:hypothetical protein
MRRAVFLVCLSLAMCGKESTEVQKNSVPADAANLDLSPGPVFTFPVQNVGSAATQSFTVKNTGKKPATGLASDFGLSISFSFDSGFPGLGGSCGPVLAPGAVCTIRVTFHPAYIADFEQPLRVAYFNGYSTVLTDYPILRGKGQ